MPRILERQQIIEGFLPVDMSVAANNGDYISLKNYKHVAVVLFKAVGAAGEPPTLTLQQAQDVSGTGAKNLTFTRVDTKQAATNLQGTGQWTKVTQAAANTYTSTNNGDKAALWVVEFDSDQLDTNNGFDCLRATVADVGATAQLGCLLYILSEPRFPTAPENMLSAIVD
jgi:hypothetical protein